MTKNVIEAQRVALALYKNLYIADKPLIVLASECLAHYIEMCEEADIEPDPLVETTAWLTYSILFPKLVQLNSLLPQIYIDSLYLVGRAPSILQNGLLPYNIENQIITELNRWALCKMMAETELVDDMLFSETLVFRDSQSRHIFMRHIPRIIITVQALAAHRVVNNPEWSVKIIDIISGWSNS